MLYPNHGGSVPLTLAALVIIGCLHQAAGSSVPSETAQDIDLTVPAPRAKKEQAMSPQKKAEALGIKFEKLKPGYLNWCNRSGKLLFTSGFASKTNGRLGKDLTTKQGYEAARECGIEILRAVWDRHGTLDGLRVIKVLGCVNSAPDFVEQPKVINGCSDLLHEVFGAKTDGHHARSALGFASLPNGAAVEIEAIFEIKD
jgi:enamine deaminase RidA (YjgF/YER057c/UK114 family)